MTRTVVILGGGLAGLTLARHLLLETDRDVVVLERRATPSDRQKVGESTVQLAGWYLGKVLDLEEHLLSEHYLKYNLRFYWEAGDPAALEGYAQGYLRALSNIPTYQLDRNLFEVSLLEKLREDPRFRWIAPARVREVELERRGPHRIAFEDGDGAREIEADWVVDATGRARWLAKRLELTKPSPVRHGASFLWVDGLLDIEKLSDVPLQERRVAPWKGELGHVPLWLATNHFCREGLWLWVIPLHGRTSLGLVFDREVVSFSDVSSGEKLRDWICRTFPLFARDLPHREIVGHAGFKDYAHDCREAISADRWALVGEAGRFSDPLYSPGSDLIAIHNTLLVDAMEAPTPGRRTVLCRQHDRMARALYEAYLPGFGPGYAALGDPEAFALKYAFELAIYFAFYVFPFVNGLFPDPVFARRFLASFSRLGPVNHGLQELLAGFTRWKASEGAPRPRNLFDFSRLEPLARTRELFHEVGLGPEAAATLVDRHLEEIVELARFTAAHVASVVLGRPEVVHHRPFVERIDPAALAFDEEALRELWAEVGTVEAPPWEWSFRSDVLESFRPAEEPLSVSAR